MAEAQTFLSGEKTIVTTNVPEPLTTVSQIITGMVLRADKTNATNIHVGPASVSAESYGLDPGESLQFDVIDPVRVYVFGKKGDFLSYFGLIP